MLIWAIINLVFFGMAASASAEPLLKMAFIEIDSPAQVKKLARMGLDIAAVREIKDQGEITGYRVEAVLSPKDELKLSRDGIQWQVAQRKRTRMSTVKQSVYHSFDEPGLGIKDQLYCIAQTYPDIVKMETIGYSHQQRPLLALCLSSREKLSEKPEVLFLATHHGREWVAPEMAMRLSRYLASNYGTDSRVTNLLDSTEVWIVPVANPDGYQYCFDHERLWRKNLRDNDEDGEITIADGVDLNRNFASRWGMDDEGSSPFISDMTYRGPSAASEPETMAVVDFINKHDFKFSISYHTYSNLILYPWGWQVKTTSFDDPIFVAQAGTDESPAIWDSILDQGYDPGVSADLYISNGDFTDWTYGQAGIPSYTVELTSGEDAEGNHYGFEFPDDEDLLQTVFEDNLEFALCLAESAKTPLNPVSPVGIGVEKIYHEPLTSSYGREQLIKINQVNKKFGNTWLLYTVNNSCLGWSKFTPAFGSNYNTASGTYFTGCQATVKNQQEGDQITYCIIGHGVFKGPYTYTVEKASGNPVLVISAEDYTGENPEYPDTSGPNYLSYYTDAMDAAAVGYDVWDVTAENGAPDYLKVLSGYDTVIWYTGDDFLSATPSELIHEELVLNIRDFMNYSDGKLFASGQDMVVPAVNFGLLSDDFFQYTLGAYLTVDGGGLNLETNEPFTVTGEPGDPVFDGLTLALNGDDSANNQIRPDSYLATSSFLPGFENSIAARYDRPGGPYDPHTGDYYVYSQMSDMAYKRLGGTFTIPETCPSLDFWISYDIELAWDFAFVEIREAGTEDWTTLPDLNGLTDQSTGDSCAEGWVDWLFPNLSNYMDTECNPEGATGQWHAFSGNSNGWNHVQMDLSAYAGKTVEIYFSYATDWGTQNLGVFVDDITITGYETESFETGFGEFTVSSTADNTPVNNWDRTEGGGFSEGPVLRTNNSVFMGFGFEAINGAETRTQVMDNIMNYFRGED
ncbi:MAG: zinc carboxypeptidase [Desulfobacteraceae bacterium]|nr:zinc carboxypeptidase [Desulfobacteraceae bacterium]